MNLRRTAVRIGIMVSGAAALAAPLGSGTIPIQAAAADPSGIQGPFRAAPAGAVSTDLSQANATVQQQGQHGQLPFRSRGGQAQLDRQKADARNQPRTPDVQAPAAAAAPSAPTPGTPAGWDAISAAESACSCLPPDGSIAVGPNHVIATVNTAFKIWTTSGGLLLSATSLPSFFGVNGGCLPNYSDPSVDYDGSANRYVLETLTYDSSYNSAICVAASQTGDPLGSWWIYAFPATPSSNLLDFPHLALGSDAIYVTANQFAGGATFTGARVYAYDKAAMYAGAAAASKYVDPGNNAAGFLADTLYPARGVTTASVEYFIAADNSGSTGSTVTIWKWTNPWLSTGTFTQQGGAAVTTYSQPPNATQPGGAAITTNDAREAGAQWSNGTLYGSHAIGCNPGSGTVACIQWYQVGNLDGTPSLVQQGIIGSNGQDRYFPNLAVDKAGDMTIAYDYSSATDYAGIRYTGRLATDPAGTVQAEAVLKAGEAAADGSRWGDYSGQVVAPDGCTVWHLGEYAKAGDLWGTWAGSFGFPQCGTPDYALAVSPSSVSVAQGGAASYTLSVNRTGGFTGAVTLSLSGQPSGVTPTFTPNPATGTSSTLTIPTASTTATGTYALTVTGVSGTLSHTATAALVVTPPPDFSLSLSPSSQTAPQGGATSYTVAVNRLNGFTGSVTMSVSGLPSGATASFAPQPTSTGSSTMTVAVAAATATGSYALTVTGSSGTLSHTASGTLVVVTPPPPANFSLSASPASVTVTRGGRATYTVTITRTNGFTGSVRFSASGAPAGARVTFNPSSTTGTSSTLTVRTSSSSPRGTFTLTITGISGSLSHTTKVTLTVK